MRFPIFITKLTLCAVLVISCFNSSAQNAKYYFDKADTFFIKYTLKGNFDSAIVYYSKAINLDSNFALAYSRRGWTFLTKPNRVDDAIKDCTKAISLKPDSTEFSECYYYRGEAYLKKGLYDSAISDYTKSIEYLTNKSDEIWDIYNSRFKSYYYTNQFDSAIQDISKVIQLRPKFAGYYNNRGVCYNSMGEYNKSVLDYLTSLVNKSHASSGNAYFNIISPLVRLKRFDEAVLFYKLYYKNKSENSLSSFLYDGKDTVKYKFYRYFVKAVLQYSENKPEDALMSLDTASVEYYSGIKDEQLRRLYVDILFLNGYISQKLGKMEDARDNYNKALVLEPRQPDITEALNDLDESQVVLRNNDRSGPVLDEESLEVTEPKNVKPTNTRQFSVVSDSVWYRIRGKAVDESGITSVKVNGFPVDFLEKGGDFSTKVTVKAGTSSLEILMTDKNNNLTTYSHLLAGAAPKIAQTSEPMSEGLGKFHAILIAEKDYVDPKFADLNYPVRDANRLKNVLIKNYTFEEKNIDTLYNRSREDILETIIARCKALGEKDNLLIFYAGHGDSTMNIKGQPDGYLIPTTARSNKTSYYITSEEIYKAIFNSRTKHILVVLDACFSGAFIKNPGWDIDGNIEDQRKKQSRRVMTSGSLTAVPDKSFFIETLTNYLSDNKDEKYVNTKDLWSNIEQKILAENKKIIEKNKTSPELKKIKIPNPVYAPITEAGDSGGVFTFEKRIK